MSKKGITIGIVVLIILILGSYFAFFRKTNEHYSLAKVVRGNVVQEVSETGTVKMGDEINFSFKTAGKINKMYVSVGDEVESGDSLASLDTSQLSLQLKESQAALAVAQAQLNKLLAGATPQEIKIAETDVANAQISLNEAWENLNQAYQDALNTLQDSNLKLYNAFTAVTSIQRTYFYSTDQESIIVGDNKTKMEDAVNSAKAKLDLAINNPTNENIDQAIPQMKKSLNTAYISLGIIRENCETPTYQNRVSSTDKTSLDTQRANVNTAMTNVTTAEQKISSMKLAQQAAQGVLNKAQDELANLKAPAQQEDIDLYESQVKQAEAQVNVLNVQIRDATIVSPTAGQITAINKRAGEIVQPAEAVISFLPKTQFQIEVDIYEEDIVKVRVGNPVDIKLTAFPDRVLPGKVISIDPAEKMVEGIVYYEVTIDFDNSPPPELKPGMTADITIKTDSRENVLTIPSQALEKKDGKNIVRVLQSGAVQERTVETGLKGEDNMVEIISGLSQGEEVILD
jgi:RND family efflux transporter MFP subunit